MTRSAAIWRRSVTALSLAPSAIVTVALAAALSPALPPVVAQQPPGLCLVIPILNIAICL